MASPNTLGHSPKARLVTNDGGALIELADQMEEQLAAGLSERQIAELVEHDEIHAGEIFGKPPLPVGAGLVLQSPAG